jgi:hypothetical protein
LGTVVISVDAVPGVRLPSTVTVNPSTWPTVEGVHGPCGVTVPAMSIVSDRAVFLPATASALGTKSAKMRQGPAAAHVGPSRP